MRSLRLLLTVAGLIIASDLSAQTQTVVVLWDNAALQAIRDTKPGPPMVARDLAIVHAAIFDSWAAYDSDAIATLTGTTLRRPDSERTLENKNKAISFAAYRVLIDLFPARKASFAQLLTSKGYDASDVSLNTTTPSGVGNVVASAVLQYRHTDGSNQLGDLHPGGYSDYTGFAPVNDSDHVNDPNSWQPLRVPDGQGGFTTQKYVAPQWGLVTPFALTSGSQFRPKLGPATYDGDPGQYRKQAEAILHLNAKLTDEQKVIAEYWADGPNSELPPGHWCLIAQYVSARDHHDLDQDVKMFFILTNALLDASISAWDSKRAFDSVRPVTALRFLFADKPIRAWAGPFLSTREIQGQDWTPYQPATFPTPPFPEFVSGHSTFSAAAAEVLLRFTNSDAYGGSYTAFAGSSKIEPGSTPASNVTLHWATFSDAADEAGMSRRYGGIHFEDADLAGRKMGRLVGAQVWTKAQHYITGN
ncbi:MAG: motif putative anchor domain protein [Acidobacteriales bacterium]|nr:motif putative anchor domain protein [Terriglobales bacterium]